MAEQEQIQTQGQTQDFNEQEPVSLVQLNQTINQDLVQDADDLLAEIDSLLEENAEEFVKNFVQKGGE